MENYINCYILFFILSYLVLSYVLNVQHEGLLLPFMLQLCALQGQVNYLDTFIFHVQSGCGTSLPASLVLLQGFS